VILKIYLSYILTALAGISRGFTALIMSQFFSAARSSKVIDDKFFFQLGGVPSYILPYRSFSQS
jgi:hypothetical protein